LGINHPKNLINKNNNIPAIAENISAINNSFLLISSSVMHALNPHFF